MESRSIVCCVTLACAGALGASAQTTPPVIVEAEPNNTRASAQDVTLADGQSISGTCSGSILDPLNASSSSADYFRITLPARAGIWRYRLTLASTGPAGHALSIRGLSQQAGVPNAASDITAQAAPTAGGVDRFVQFYSVGDGVATPRVTVRVTGTASTSSYTLTLTGQSVRPVRFNRLFRPGVITITTAGRTSVDTDMALLDDRCVPIAGASCDDTPPTPPSTSGSVQSTLVRTLDAGIYYVAVSDFDLAHSNPAPSDDANRSGTLLPDPGIICTGSSLTGLELGLSVSPAGGTAQLPAGSTIKAGAFDVNFYKLRVACNAADVARVGGSAVPDNQLSPDDVIVFLRAFVDLDTETADIASIGGNLGPDGVISADDIIAFLRAYFEGCS
jgi:hypothetical protein